ncbi:OLC1v1012512C1 [Oldenlandia corymbosa var. corymbosa]|uniref:OLC1v1012512C1 n=1 Tax=Oldenlandia corymbosa var. corymbosa TaxID=529605 RepID=A0AAV1DY11_OLDCO|nr:OLC1v1012512C1 [Oldenlandia corymbosa var. corymbosa]
MSIVLKKTFKKLDHDINVQEFLDTSTPSVEELCNQVSLLRGQLTDIHKKLSWWSNPEKVEDVEHLRQMESSLRESLSRVRAHKENFVKHQLMPLDGPSQLMPSNSFENAMQFPITMDDHQQDPGLPWIPNDENLHAAMPENSHSHYLSRRDLEYPGDLSLPGCSGLFSTGKGSEIDNTAFIDNIDSSRDFSLPCPAGFFNRNVEETEDIRKIKVASKEASISSCSSFLNSGKEIEVDSAGQVDNLTRESSAMDDLNAIACLRLQLGGQHPYYPYSHLNIPDMKNLEVGRAVNFQENPINYQMPGNFELPGSIIENSSHTWTPASNNCDINMINEISFPQTANHP